MFLAVSLYGVFYRSFILCWDALAHGGIKCFWLCHCMVYFTGFSFFVGMHWRTVASKVLAHNGDAPILHVESDSLDLK